MKHPSKTTFTLIEMLIVIIIIGILASALIPRSVYYAKTIAYYHQIAIKTA